MWRAGNKNAGCDCQSRLLSFETEQVDQCNGQSMRIVCEWAYGMQAVVAGATSCLCSAASSKVWRIFNVWLNFVTGYSNRSQAGIGFLMVLEVK